MNLSMPIMVIIHPKAILFKIIKQHGLITINSKLLYQKIIQFYQTQFCQTQFCQMQFCPPHNQTHT
jgi:hypothetical protein